MLDQLIEKERALEDTSSALPTLLQSPSQVGGSTCKLAKSCVFTLLLANVVDVLQKAAVARPSKDLR